MANGRLSTSSLTKMPNTWSNRDRDEYLRADAYASLTRMLARAVAETNSVFTIYDAYRSYEEQVGFFTDRYTRVLFGGDKRWNGKRYKLKKGQAKAAVPGTSNHGEGVSIDVHPAPIQRWLKANASRFGWVNDVKSEPWHWSYLRPGSDQYKSEGVLDHAWVQRAVGATVDGKIGPATVVKIKEWQRANGLEADGKIGPSSKAKLRGEVVPSIVEAVEQAIEHTNATKKVRLNTDYTIENHPTKNVYKGRIRERDGVKQTGELSEIAIHHWGSDGQKFNNVVTWLVADGNGNNNSSAHEVIEGARVAVLAGYEDGTWNSGTMEGNLNNYGLELRPEADELTIRTAAARIKAVWDHAGREVPLRPHKSYVSTECPGRYTNLLDVLVRLARGEEVEITATSVVPAVNPGRTDGKLEEDGRWGEATSREVQSRIGVAVDGRMGPASWSALQAIFGTPVDGTVSKQSHRASDLGNGISDNGWNYTGPGSSGSTLIEALQHAVGAQADGVLGEGTTKKLQQKLNSDPNFLKNASKYAKADGRFGEDSVKAAQKFLNSRGAKLTVDGKAGTEFWKALQRYLGTPVDGKVSNQSFRASDLGNGITQGWEYTGPGSKGSSMVRALQKWLGVEQDGVWGEGTSAAFQRKLIDHGFPV